MKKTLITVGVFAVIIAAVVVGVLLGGGANAQFVGLRCDVDKPEGEYELCDAVADFDDLMPVEYSAYTFADGSVVDKWAVDAEYYGGEDFDYRSTKEGRHNTTDVYALSSGEVLLEVRHHINYEGIGLPDVDVLAVGMEYYEDNLPCDLIGQLGKAYLELGRAKANSMPFAFKTIEIQTEVSSLMPGEWRITASPSIGYLTPRVDTGYLTPKVNGYSSWWWSSQLSGGKSLDKKIYRFDRTTGELLSKS